MRKKRFYLAGFSLTDFLVGLALTSAVIAVVVSGLNKSISLSRLASQQAVLAQANMAIAQWYWRNMESIPKTSSYQMNRTELQNALANLAVEIPAGSSLVATIDTLQGQIRTCLNFSQLNQGGAMRCVESRAGSISLPSQSIP